MNRLPAHVASASLLYLLASCATHAEPSIYGIDPRPIGHVSQVDSDRHWFTVDLRRDARPIGIGHSVDVCSARCSGVVTQIDGHTLTCSLSRRCEEFFEGRVEAGAAVYEELRVPADPCAESPKFHFKHAFGSQR